MTVMQTGPLQMNDASGAIGRLLADAGVPYAGALGSALTFLIAFVALYLAGRIFLLPIVNRMMDGQGLDKHLQRTFRRVTMVIVVFVAIGVAFGFAGYGSFLTSLATVAAAATLAIGLAMQGVLRNFIAGVFVYTDKPFRIGDWIEFDDYSGVVEDISFRVSRVRTFDNELLTVPNSKLTDDVIKNPVAKDKLRVQFLFGIGYDDDIETATNIIVEEAETHDDILEDPGPSVRLTELGGSSVGLKSRVWIADPSRSDFLKIRGEYVTNVKQRFDEEGINIPYPTRTLEGDLEVANTAVEEAEAAGDD